ncbi:peptidase associated/transthyretin-like domain-containing protein [Mucilaginibacter polytrichastri]|uniref:Uncharacterized protein n=1 Tax=Mucilaginibacter polytrichastri TaxID=1302689 RepID=A0A1Q6A3Q3_9SPHI|nr:hypothetical protein [Mucilaginibacter polytrichastri]OKS88633.1 hypothetical protein RG47T_4105 [Mucilaginibacter polytrichastri]SFT26371.1 hypothetical protein SAMN04487890_12514 [Mucilaginibacter polytrichastri]
MPQFRKIVLLIHVSLLSVFFGPALFAQKNLNREITIGSIRQQPIGKVLQNISQNGRFSFAYNNNTIPSDSLISLQGYSGSLFILLTKLLGSNYEFKDIDGYVVLRHTPNRLSITAEVVITQDNEVVVKGNICDNVSGARIKNASVYEKNLLISSLTDADGNFELKLKAGAGSVGLTVSKESYRDTSLFILSEVKVYYHKVAKNYDYYPEGTGKRLESNRFARLFISSKQIIQGMNLGNYFATSAYQISLTPGLSSHGMYNSQVIDHVSLNLLGGYTAGINGIEAGGVFNINRKNMQYVQLAGAFNLVGGNVSGLQAAGIYNNVYKSAFGVQLAGCANIDSMARGLQVAGLINKTKGKNSGMQLAGLFNMAAETKGIQLAGLGNWSSGQTGSQISGLFNVGKKVKGFQLAMLINVADSSDYPVGLINLVKTGEKSIAVSTDELWFTHIDLRSGGRVLYGLVGTAFKFNVRPAYALSLGIGAHIIHRSRFSLDGEYVNQQTFNMRKNLYQTNGLKLLPGYRFTKTLRVFAGPSIQEVHAGDASDADLNGWVFSKRYNQDGITALHAGLTMGIQYVW